MSVSQHRPRTLTLEQKYQQLQEQVNELRQELATLRGEWMGASEAARLVNRSPKALTNLASRRPEGEGVWWRWNASQTRREFNPQEFDL